MADNEILNLYQKLLKEWSNKNLDQCKSLLEQLKIPLTKNKFLPTNEHASKQELSIARDILEIGAQYSAIKRDISSFERYFAQLKCYYFDYGNEIPESAYKYQLLGLNLLSLLAQNRVADFHTELEVLPVKELQNNIYIRYPVSLEQWLMEGSYNKVFISKSNVPVQTYIYFIEILLNTIREEIANCIENAFESISLPETARMLYLENISKLDTFIEKRKWNVDKQTQSLIFLTKDEKNLKQNDDGVSEELLAITTIEYAKELEKIV